ncbi:hypothetical protein [Sinomonas halotolerans]|uniref:Fis family transcriptional regulator n=1 Tax=Sinomonas halotolerans TaxID=1644133 RepID=A0ABU9WWF3_9MICC
MRWESLFEDFEAQLASAARLDAESEVSERVRAEQGALGMAERLRGHGQRPVDLLLRGGVRLRGRLAQLAEAWLVLEEGPQSALVPLAGIVTVSGLGRAAREEGSAVRRKLSLASGLRALARDRALVTCVVDAGRGEPLLVAGTLDTVGRDYAEVANRSDEWGRGPAGTVVVPFAALIAVRSGM